MQELRSTEILDKEIEADAKRKAEAILKRAEEECADILASVDKNLNLLIRKKKNFIQKSSRPLKRI